MSEGLDRLFATIAARKGADPAQSYTANLLAQGVETCAKKFGEEAIETVIAAITVSTASSPNFLAHFSTPAASSLAG